MPGAQIAAGDVSFTCNMNGKAAVGKFIAGTIVPSPGRSPLWFVYRIYGYLAPADRKAERRKNLPASDAILADRSAVGGAGIAVGELGRASG